MNRTVSIYMNPNTYEKLSKIAENQERSLNWLINKILNKYLEDQENASK